MTHRSALVVVLLAAGLVACGGGAGDGVTTTEAGSTVAPGEATTVAPDDRPLAPDFTLSLQPEGEFVLSEAGKPVYLVFWAEW